MGIVRPETVIEAEGYPRERVYARVASPTPEIPNRFLWKPTEELEEELGSVYINMGEHSVKLSIEEATEFTEQLKAAIAVAETVEPLEQESN